MRVQRHPILEFPPGESIPFYLNGKKVYGRRGEPIAVALIDNGIKVFSHSRRYGRPRGLFCATGNCCSCLMEVDGRVNVRTCVTLLREGMEVKSQSLVAGTP